jgi:DNA-binding CsgD family transcriptional regulator
MVASGRRDIYGFERNARDRMITPALVCPIFVGRQLELDELVRHARAAARGRGRLVLIDGDAGIGKSRLVRAVRERLGGGRGALVLGGCSEFGGLAYEPFLEIFAALGAPEALSAQPNQSELFETAGRRFEELSAHRSTVCVIEDLHWADDATLQLLVFLARRIASYRVLLIVTYRSDELHRDHPVLPYVGKLTRGPNVTRIHLAPLAPSDLRDLIRATLEGRGALVRPVVEQIVKSSEGNPFFAEELLKNAFERLHFENAENVPIAIRATVAERLRLYDDAQRRTLACAALLGRPFDLEFLARISERNRDETLQTLRRACDLQILVEIPSDPVTYRFRHALTREAVARELMIAEARPIHRRIAEALEAIEPQPIPDIGYHYWAARQADKARIYNELAGDEAERVHAHTDAVRSYERALDVAADDVGRAELLARIGENLLLAGDVERAAHVYGSATALLRDAGRIREAAALHFRLIEATYLSGDGRRAIELGEAALVSLSTHDATAHDERALVTLVLAYLFADQGRLETARSLLESASSAPTSDDSRTATMYQNVRLRCATLEGNADALREAARSYLEVARRFGNDGDDVMLRAELNIASAAFVLGLDEWAGREFATIFPRLRERQWSAYEAWHRGLEALRLFRAGDLTEARSMLESALSLPDDVQLARISLATAALHVGGAVADDDVIERTLSTGLFEIALRTGSHLSIGAFAGPYARRLAAGGKRAAAIEALDLALATPANPLVFGETLLAAAALGDESLCARARLSFEAASRQLASAPPVRAYRALFEALTARRFGDSAQAVVHAQRAREEFGALGWRYYVALATEAAGEREAAVASFREMGAIRDVRRLELGPSSNGAVRAERDALSPRERQIAELMAQADSNKVIAQKLSLSEKTIEKYITSLYQKLGFSKRAELTAYIIRGGERGAERAL